MPTIGHKQQIQQAPTRAAALDILRAVQSGTFPARYVARCARAFVHKWGAL